MGKGGPDQKTAQKMAEEKLEYNMIDRDEKLEKIEIQADVVRQALMVSSLKTFRELMKMSTINKLFKLVSQEDFKKYNDGNFIPHYIVNGAKAFRTKDVCQWVIENLVSYNEGNKIITKFISYPQKNNTTKSIPPQLIGIKGDLQEVGPPPPCVYFLIDVNEIVYVGQTINIYSRLLDHERSNKIYTRALYIPVCKDELEKVERGFINSLVPKYNKDGKTIKRRKTTQNGVGWK